MTATTPTSTTLGRAFDLYQRTAASRSAIALVIANAIPLIGVLFFGWSLITILVIFWVENGIVGLWNIPRILMARGSVLRELQDMSAEAAFNATGNARTAAELRARWQQAQAEAQVEIQQSRAGVARPIAEVVLPGGFGRAAIAGFFLFHYGMFWLVHGVFVFALPSFLGFMGSGGRSSPFGVIAWSNVALAALVLFLSHGASFFLNYLGKREYLTTSAARQMFAPYGRVVMLHLTIIFGAFLVAFLGAPIGALLVLVVVKTVFDLQLHLRQHQTRLIEPVGVPNPA